MTPGTLIAVCGLHGGAGTTGIAHLAAATLAAARPAGEVLLCETDPVGGDLAARLQATSPYALSDLALLRGQRAAVTAAPFVQLPGGLRLLAAAAAERHAADAELVADVLSEARDAHHVTVVDCATLREPHAWPALSLASHVIWVTRADAAAPAIAAKLAGPLTRPAQLASWVLAITASTAETARLSALRNAAPTVRATVRVPDVADSDETDEKRRLAGQTLLSALA